MCSLSKHLERRMGPGLVYTLTPCCGLVTTYREVAQQCGSNVSLMQVQTYSSWEASGDLSTYGGQMFGWPKTIWSVGTGTLSHTASPGSAQSLWNSVKKFLADHPEAKGLFTWTAEKSYACTPAFCAEEIAWHAQREAQPRPGLLDCKC